MRYELEFDREVDPQGHILSKWKAYLNGMRIPHFMGRIIYKRIIQRQA